MCTGSNVTTLLSPAARLTAWCTVIGLPPLGSVIVASRSPVWAAADVFLTVPLSVRSVLERSAALTWLTCASESASVLETCRRTGYFRPVFWSRAACVQSLKSWLSIAPGLFA